SGSFGIPDIRGQKAEAKGEARSGRRPGRPDFEATTKDVHRAAEICRGGKRRLTQLPPTANFSGNRTTALGTRSPGKLRRGGTPQHGGLGKRPGRLRDRALRSSHTVTPTST